tara:strand:+ start:270 stop:707 length:438 start_codon:yes stop_codon:yes gene_type:complete
MAITYTNVIYEKVIDNLHTILADEFNIAILYDDTSDRPNQSFLVTPVSDSLDEQLTTGSVREYTININYQIDFGGNYTKNSIKQVSLVAERIKRLIKNNENYTVSSERQWHNAMVNNIEYLRNDDDSNLLEANIETSFKVMEIIS